MPGSIYDNEMILKNEIAAGNESAFKIFFDQYYNSLLRYIIKLVKSKEIAEELVMDIFLKLWLAKTTIPEIENLNGFMFRVAYNKTMDFFRSAAKNEKFVDVLFEQIEIVYSTPETGYHSLLSKEYEQQLRKAIDLLPEKRRNIYELSRDGMLSHDEIAQKLNISKSTVANSIVLAKEFIKENLKNTIDIQHVILLTIMYYTKC